MGHADEMSMTASSRGYHHGDLANALVDAALELARPTGAAGITIRAVTRRVGVSPSAAYRHFADLEALVLATAQRVNVKLAASMQAAIAELGGADPRETAVNRLRGVGLGYIGFALAEPGWFELAFAAQGAVATGADPAAPAVGVTGATPSPFDLLMSALDAMVEAGALRPERREHAQWPCWSTVHGFAELVGRGPLRRLPEPAIERLAALCVDTIIAGLDLR